MAPMEHPHGIREEDGIGRKRFAVVLVRPENFENVGLTARAMRNTGFSDLRCVGIDAFGPEAYRTAVHAETLLDRAKIYPDLGAATKSLHLVFASTARSRKTFSIVTFAEMVEIALGYPRDAGIGLLFGNERTGLTSEEMGSANYVFSIPQASRQPSFNLASAVLLTLFSLFERSLGPDTRPGREKPLSREVQEDCIRVVLMKLEKNGFIYGDNKAHVTEMVQDIFGRIGLTDKDRRFLMAVFNKGLE
jgi:TrmH family RNA methyltransferase